MQVDHVAVFVAENLHLDVLGARDVAFQEHRRIAEGAPGLALRLVEQTRQIARLVHHAHAAAAAAERRLDDERKTDFAWRSSSASSRSSTASSVPGSVGTPTFCARARAAVLSPISSSNSARGPDKRDARLRAGPGELGILGQESVARMDQVHALFLGQRDDARDIQIGADRAFAFADDDRPRPP